MDAVELARQTAARLHAEAVAAKRDPRQPYAFALAEAERRGLTVEPVLAGAAMLDGGRATLLAADQLILHENIGSDFDRAFLVVHEIGHAECGDSVLGDGSRHVAATIDPTRPAEPSPTGLDRVVDYGSRQRREVQMDLFAREFLLPREVVRQLHLEEGLGLKAIAERFNAPLEVVAQQLLDALLLPPAASALERAEKPRDLNREQLVAAVHRGPAYLLEAGPGTGKTQTLVARVEGLLAEGVDARRILLLTFSNKAAGEMADRIASKDKKAAAAMWIGTFHAFGLDLVRRFHAELGFTTDPRMMDRTEAVELLEHEFPRLGLVHYRNLYDPTSEIADILSAISRAKDEVVDEAAYASLAAKMKATATTEEERVLAEKAAEVAHVYAAYETLKRRSNCIDFGDLVSLPVRLLESNLEIQAHCRAQYDHVLVDEYQDVNRSSVRLLTTLKPEGTNLWVVGDARQSIYRFRGASSYNVTRFGSEDFPGGIKGQLVRNYRSVREITQAFSSFAAKMPGAGTPVDFSADRGANGHLPELRTVDFADRQAVAIADCIEEMRAGGNGYRDQAVLCTGNDALSKLGQNLERLGIPVLYLGSLFERPESRDLLSLLSLLVDRRAMGLVRAACWPDFTMSLGDVAAVITHLKDHESAPGAWLHDPAVAEVLSSDGRASLQKLKGALDGFAAESSPWTVLATVLLDRTRLAARLATSGEMRDRARAIAIWQLMNFVRSQPTGAGLPIQRLLDRVRRLLRLRDDRDLRQLPTAAQGLDAVRLMTFHGAKGLEFPVVHLFGMNRGTLPRAGAPPACPPPDGMVAGGSGNGLADFRSAHDQEQECLFYVGCSRARDRLFLFAHTKIATGAKRDPSPFIDRLGAGVAKRTLELSRALPEIPEEAPIGLEVEGALRFGSQQIALYERCPRRFFYTHILTVGGRRTATAFLQMHDAVRTVFEGLIADGAGPGGPTLEDRLAAAFDLHGLTGHGYESHYRDFALVMLRYFATTREGHAPEERKALSLRFGAEEIIVKPDDVLIRADGVRSFRTIRTGHQSDTEGKDVGAAAFMLAAQEAFPGAIVELVYLSDGVAAPLPLSKVELQNRRQKLTAFLEEIRSGRFPPRPSSWNCPNCPSLFICGPTPDGTLKKKF